ncbi:MAG: Uma2 family endonuclease [Phycisphaeraceae bacterium]
MIVKAGESDQPIVDLEAMPPWRCSSERYLELIASGVLGPSDKVELINGMITAMSPAGPKHDFVIRQLTRLLASVMPECDLQIQGTVHIDNGQIFDPDVAVIKRYSDDTLKHRHAGPDDILLIIEAALSSMRRDAQVKMPIYARAGIPEYWVVDIENESLIVHRDPQNARYKSIQTYQGEEGVEAASLQGLSITPAAIFG